MANLKTVETFAIQEFKTSSYSAYQEITYSISSLETIQIDFQSNEKLRNFIAFLKPNDEKALYKLLKSIRFNNVLLIYLKLNIGKSFKNKLLFFRNIIYS